MVGSDQPPRTAVADLRPAYRQVVLHDARLVGGGGKADRADPGAVRVRPEGRNGRERFGGQGGGPAQRGAWRLRLRPAPRRWSPGPGAIEALNAVLAHGRTGCLLTTDGPGTSWRSNTTAAFPAAGHGPLQLRFGAPTTNGTWWYRAGTASPPHPCHPSDHHRHVEGLRSARAISACGSAWDRLPSAAWLFPAGRNRASPKRHGCAPARPLPVRGHIRPCRAPAAVFRRDAAVRTRSRPSQPPDIS